MSWFVHFYRVIFVWFLRIFHRVCRYITEAIPSIYIWERIISSIHLLAWFSFGATSQRILLGNLVFQFQICFSLTIRYAPKRISQQNKIHHVSVCIYSICDNNGINARTQRIKRTRFRDFDLTICVHNALQRGEKAKKNERKRVRKIFYDRILYSSLERSRTKAILFRFYFYYLIDVFSSSYIKKSTIFRFFALTWIRKEKFACPILGPIFACVYFGALYFALPSMRRQWMFVWIRRSRVSVEQMEFNRLGRGNRIILVISCRQWYFI